MKTLLEAELGRLKRELFSICLYPARILHDHKQTTRIDNIVKRINEINNLIK